MKHTLNATEALMSNLLSKGQKRTINAMMLRLLKNSSKMVSCWKVDIESVVVSIQGKFVSVFISSSDEANVYTSWSLQAEIGSRGKPYIYSLMDGLTTQKEIKQLRTSASLKGTELFGLGVAEVVIKRF